MIDLFISLFQMPPRRERPPLDTHLAGPNVTLRMFDVEDWNAWHSLRELSRAYLEPWEPKWPSHALTYGYYCSLLRRHWRDWRSGHAYAFGIFLRSGDRPATLVGGITLGDILYAAAQKGTVGYWIGKPYANQGLMTEALGLICDFAFSTLKLQRIEASCLPTNEPSKAVLRHCGFEQEGYAKAYLQINGKREDHILWGKNCVS
ncbi:MAG: GNAT family protein [Alphaproteobacteria bacterium]|nr:GNAT family protein [Alphaproteobacteria bacterium]